MSKIKVLIVDDAVVMRRMISNILEKDPEIEIAGVAANGRLALAKIPQCNPDVITLDIEMPEMDGLETVTEIRKLYPKLPVIMFSTLSVKGASQTLDALARGANDYVAKPANVGSVSESVEKLETELIPKIKAQRSSTIANPGAHFPKPPSAPIPTMPSPARSGVSNCLEVLAIGSSTGGPNALNVVIPGLPADFPLPVVIVQHMPALFTGMLAQRLNECSKVRVHEAVEGQAILPGNVYIAPGGKHLELTGSKTSLRAHLQEGPPENSCRPAVDVLFRSVASIFGGNVLAVILTGMGQDGLRGTQVLREAGARVIAQDQASSVVWGMPRAIAEAGIADQILPLQSIPDAILGHLKVVV